MTRFMTKISKLNFSWESGQT